MLHNRGSDAILSVVVFVYLCTVSVVHRKNEACRSAPYDDSGFTVPLVVRIDDFDDGLFAFITMEIFTKLGLWRLWQRLRCTF